MPGANSGRHDATRGPKVEVPGDTAALAAAAARHLAGVVSDALERQPTASIALSGGETPVAMLAELAELPVPWDRVHVFQVDERVAPAGDPSRNAVMLESLLVDKVDIPRANVHLMPVERDDLDAAARAYSEDLDNTCAGVLDLVHLGLGDDGHTASWPPGDPVLDVHDRDVTVVGPFRGKRRMTLTVPAVNRSRRILWLVSGGEKAPVLARLLAGDRALPAARVRPEDAEVLADEAAASELGRA